MSTRAWGAVIAVAGAALVVVSLLADPIGIGGTDGFGWKQIAGAIVGGVGIVAGLAMMFLPMPSLADPGPEE
jgi:hypothetical protein